MKSLYILIIMALMPSFIIAQNSGFVVDEKSIDLESIPENYIGKAKSSLHIGYGHTSHGSQLTSGMNAIESYFENGKYDWSHSGGEGKLHLFEGSSYGEGYLDHDCGYDGWDDKTREYLNDHPGCNVIIWSWCGQVNSVELQEHYLDPMSTLEQEYSDVKFVYMTGHLEGLGQNGSLRRANDEIRDFCSANNKILFDFARIERFDPDMDVDYQQHNADDACNYDDPEGGSSNWADNWLSENPGHLLANIAQHCSSCAHSRSLNCVKKGVACWYLWARIAGWDGSTSIEDNFFENKNVLNIAPNPAGDKILLQFDNIDAGNYHIKITDLIGEVVLRDEIIFNNKIERNIDISRLNKGVYIVNLSDGNKIFTKKLIVN